MSGSNGSVINRNVLMLNQNYEPLTICSARRAIVLLFQGKGEMIETADGLKIHTVSRAYSLPSVVRLWQYKRVPFRKIMLSRKNIITRDGHRCQYSDPGVKANITHDETFCYLGFDDPLSVNLNDWHTHSFRAYTGASSLHFGQHVPNPPFADTSTTRLSQLDAVEMERLFGIKDRSGLPLLALIDDQGVTHLRQTGMQLAAGDLIRQAIALQDSDPLKSTDD